MLPPLAALLPVLFVLPSALSRRAAHPMAETSEPSCCPAGSAGYLAADYATAGAFASFGEGAAKVDCYVSGDAAARCAVATL